MTHYWANQNFRLRFQLSDLTVFTHRIPVLAHACTLSEILSGRAPDIPPESPAPAQGYLIRGCPGSPSEDPFERTRNGFSYTLSRYEHCYIDLRSSFEAYRSKFSSKTRSTITRKVARFAALSGAPTRFERYRTPSELRVFHELARQVSVLTYQEQLLDLGLPGDADFLRDMTEAGAADRVRAFLLLEGDKAVAYLYCPVVDGAVVYSYLGFDPTYSERSPGTVLLWLSLQSLFDERVFSFFDFTEGESPQKQFFSTGRVPCFNRLYVRGGFLTETLLRGHHAFDQGSSRLGRILDKFALKQRVKQLLRGR